MERQKIDIENQKKQKKERKEDENFWKSWYSKVKDIDYIEYSRSKNIKKRKEKFNDYLEEISDDWFFSKRINYIDRSIEKLSDEKKVNLLLVHKKELKKKKEQDKKDKLKLFIKNENELKIECNKWGIEYVEYEQIPKDQWKKNEYGNQWYERNYYISSRYKNMIIKINNKKKIKEFLEEEKIKEKECETIGINYIPYEKPIPDDLNYNWTSKNSFYSSERNIKMREDKKYIEIKKEWNKLTFDERKNLTILFEKIKKEKEEKKRKEEKKKRKENEILLKKQKEEIEKKNKEILKKGYNYKKNYTDNENTDEYVMIGGMGGCVFRKKNESRSDFLERVNEEKRNLNPYN